LFGWFSDRGRSFFECGIDSPCGGTVNIFAAKQFFYGQDLQP